MILKDEPINFRITPSMHKKYSANRGPSPDSTTESHAEESTCLFIHNADRLENPHTQMSSGIFVLNGCDDSFDENHSNKEDYKQLGDVSLNVIGEADNQYPVEADVDIILQTCSSDAPYSFAKSKSKLPTVHSTPTDTTGVSNSIPHHLSPIEQGDAWEIRCPAPRSPPGMDFCPVSKLGRGATTKHSQGASPKDIQDTGKIIAQGKEKPKAHVSQLIDKIEVLETYYYVKPAEWNLLEDPKLKKWRVVSPSRLRKSVSTILLFSNIVDLGVFFSRSLSYIFRYIFFVKNGFGVLH